MKKNKSLFVFLAGLLTGLFVMILYIYFGSGGRPGFSPNPNSNDLVKFTSSNYGYQGPDEGNQSIKNFDSNHVQIHPTYYIDTAGFEQLIKKKDAILRIDFGCNGDEGKVSHRYQLMFSGYDTAKHAQFFAAGKYEHMGAMVEGPAYLDKTCPCPLTGGQCNCPPPPHTP